jgi:hypothetical protein
MKQAHNPNANDDILNRLLEEHLAGPPEQLEPSSGFATSVMESIHAQAAEPPPIAFPWRRVVPGLLAILCCLSVLFVAILRAGIAGKVAGLTSQPITQHALSLTHTFTAGEATLCWTLLAACLSIAAIAASFRMTGRSN